MKKKKKWPFVLLALVLIIGAFWVYEVPLYRFLAERKLEDYIVLQGASSSDICSKRVFKDYTQGGYYLEVEYCSDPNIRYSYHYYTTAKRGGKRKFHIMSCVVFDDENVEISLSDKTAKYPAVLSGEYI